ncbi:DUF1707 SHOCT-like domain-containing protein [Catenuloplanes indicus]|uniref:Cell wall-active antibiotics response LiaF-like C-terminal domain-containing protein n=1 Tax=Catenuloplanes indicus TaxID=137267 RepID=A0AAE3W830_9ACTN|nr:DUF1707 domain-containing protein [Catenuloplanes indicus]MDQ0370222.1 hypothetical protein [Catenuloplanes indicus]
MSDLLPEPVDPRQLRASDSDRERVAEVLRAAASDGRLDLHELDERLGLVYSARTYGELEPLTRDLPLVVATPANTVPDGNVPLSRGGFALMSRFVRRGRWAVGRVFSCLAFWGGGTIDLRDAYFAEGSTRINAFAVMGGVEVIVPEDANVHVTGLAIMGGFDHGANGAGAPGAPTVVVSGFAFWGGVEIKRRASDAEIKRRKLEKKRLKGA